MRLGIDLGGSKIAGVALDPDGRERAARRVATPKHDYRATISAIRDLVGRLEHEVGGAASVGLGMPGSIVPATGLVQNANSTWLNGQPFAADLEAALARPVRLENDANCFALSESFDGAGAAAASVFGVIIGTGCGGGLVSGGRLVSGPRAIGGEWGHNPLAWPDAGETPGERCWCGRYGCMETWVSGPGLVRDHVRHGGADLAVEEIARLAAGGDDAARKTLDRHASRLARGLAIIINVFDP